MITELTPEQKAKFPFYIDKWIKIGLSTEPADRPRAEQAIKNLYKLAKLKKPKIIWCSDSIAGCETAMKNKNSIVHSDVSSAVNPVVNSFIRSAINSVVNLNVNSAVHSVIDSAITSVVDLAVNSAADSMYSAMRLAIGKNCYLFHAYFGGSLWAGYSARADFFNRECGIEIDRNYLDMVELCGYFWTLDGLAILTDRPEVIHRNKEGQLHHDKEMAIKYRSGWGLYALNGVKMKPEYVLTDAEKLDPEVILKEENAEQRKELIRKIGIERMKKYGKVVHLENNYQLIDMATVLPSINYAPHLFMENASIKGMFHLEPVHPDCKTVQHAINWRKYKNINKTWKPDILT